MKILTTLVLFCKAYLLQYKNLHKRVGALYRVAYHTCTRRCI